jgi:hypothetical protein
MADIKIPTGAGCSSCGGNGDGCCERAERGKRGKRGPVGPTGPAGSGSGSTGPTGAAGATGATGAAGAGLALNAAMFFGTTAGTGSDENDYTGTVAVGAAVPFPQNGPSAGVTSVARASGTQFILGATGVYEVSWAVAFLEESQLQVALNGTGVFSTTTLSGAGTQINSNTVLISATAGDVLTIINPPGNATALTVQTADGSMTHAQAPSLVIRRIS